MSHRDTAAVDRAAGGPRHGTTHDDAIHVVVGAGPLGLAVAGELARSGVRIRIVTRGGRAADAHGDTEVLAADVSDPDHAMRAFEGASVVYHCAAPRYSTWPTKLPSLMDGVIVGAAANGARIVYGDNLYVYGRVQGPITEDLPHRPVGPNGRTRARVADALMEAHAAGAVQATIGRASDFFGPHALNSTVGERIFGRMLAGKRPQVLGDPDVLHTVTFVSDFARALVTLGSREEALGGAWHVPSAETVTIREFVGSIAEQLGRPTEPSVTPPWVLAAGGLFDRDLRAVRAVVYQSQDPWVVDHSKFERTFGGVATPHPEAIRITLGWFSDAAKGSSAE